jgi:hypothetical protein
MHFATCLRPEKMPRSFVEELRNRLLGMMQKLVTTALSQQSGLYI